MKIKKLKDKVTLRTFKKAFYVNAERTPRENSLVKFNIKPSEIDPRFRKKVPFKQNELYVFLGEIVNMPGHCIVANYKTGKFYFGVHSNYFSEFNATQKIEL